MGRVLGDLQTFFTEDQLNENQPWNSGDRTQKTVNRVGVFGEVRGEDRKEEVAIFSMAASDSSLLGVKGQKSWF